MENSFAKLNAIDVGNHIEKKGSFAYLSWPYAVAQLRLADPAACWEVKRFDGIPYLATDAGVFVEVAVTVQGVTLSQIHPVLDGRNRPILAPTAFDINSSIQRCLVKAIALHGLGLYIYAGEDLPELGNPETTTAVIKLAKPRAVAKSSLSATISKEQQTAIQNQIDEVGGDAKKLLDYFGLQSLSDIPVTEYERVMKSLEKGRRQTA